ncbi:MAG TPA: hypothetical protein DIU15_03575, partial [Deltaproteobacteria bacterium]|nr:hypothetical protein [Deltaproteobacteria bacterium]
MKFTRRPTLLAPSTSLALLGALVLAAVPRMASAQGCPAVEDEQVSSSWLPGSGASRFRGNLYEVTQPGVVLTSYDIYLDAPAGANLSWVVWVGDGTDGATEFTIADQTATGGQAGGYQWVSSPDFDLDLEVGKVYGFSVHFSSAEAVGYEYANTTFPQSVSFGHITAGIMLDDLDFYTGSYTYAELDNPTQQYRMRLHTLNDASIDTDSDGDPDCTDLDDDDDGDPDTSDCAELDSTIFNGAPEDCDGVDSDCSGDLAVDEQEESSWLQSSAASRFRGNIYSVTSPVFLTSYELYLDAPVDANLSWVVWEGDAAESGTTFTIADQTATAGQAGGFQWVSSPDFDLYLEPGKAYGFSVHISDDSDVGYQFASTTFPQPVSFGAIEAGLSLNGIDFYTWSYGYDDLVTPSLHYRMRVHTVAEEPDTCGVGDDDTGD